jgi:simple sugar transport system substrate-binding protein
MKRLFKLRLFNLRFLGRCAGLLLALAGAGAAADPLKVAFVYLGPVGDGGWTYQHELGRQAVEKAFGDRVKLSYVENVPETADAERVIRQLAAAGNQLIFTTSFGYMEPTLKVARLFPKVHFEHATGYKTAANVSCYQARFYEGAYLLGIIAGRMTKTNTLGWVGSFPIPEVVRNVDAFTLGARSVNPKVRTKVIWVDTWYDPAKERQAAETLVAQGADVLGQNTDSPAALQVAQEKGVYGFGWDSDMVRYAPKAHLTANMENWGAYYVKRVQDQLDGNWKPENTRWGFTQDLVRLAEYNKAIPADLVALVEDRKKAISEGRLFVFSGPIRDPSGAIRVAAGTQLPEDQLWSLNWYVEGIEGKLPSN